MSVERVKSFFEQYGMKDRILEFDVSSATVELAAAALSCEPGRIAKTLSFMVEGHGILVVAAVSFPSSGTKSLQSSPRTSRL